MVQRNRRRVLQASGAALATALAGCQGGSSDDGESGESPEKETSATRETETGTDDGTTGETDGPIEPVTVDEEWRAFQNGPRNLGATTNTDPAGQVERRWEFADGQFSGVTSQPALGDGSLYMVDSGGYLHSVDASSGEQEWGKDIAGHIQSPVYADGSVFVENDVEGLLALDGATGERLWQNNPAESTPLGVVGDTLYGYSFETVFSVDTETGETRWSHTLEDPLNTGARPAVGDGVVVLDAEIDDGAAILALDADSGERLWRKEIPEEANEFLSIVDGSVYVPTYKSILTIDAANGDRLMQFDGSGSDLSWGATYANGTVYVQDDTNITAYDTGSGEQQWQVASNRPKATVTENGLVVARWDALAYHDLDSGELQWELTDIEPRRTPVVANGLVFTGADSKLVALQAA